MRGWLEGVGSEVVGEELGPRGGGDHGGIVGGERDGREGDGEFRVGGAVGEDEAQMAVGGDAPTDEDPVRSIVLGGIEGGASEILDDRVLKAGDEVQGFSVEVRQRVGEVGLVRLCFMQAEVAESLLAGGDGGVHGMELDVAASGCLDAGERHVEARGVYFLREDSLSGELGRGITCGLLFDLREGKQISVGDAVASEGIHPGAAGVGQAEQLGYLVVGFAGCVVERFADVAVVPCLLRRAGGEVEVCVAAADDQGEERSCLGERIVHKNSVDVAFQMIDGDQRKIGAEGEGLGEADADQKCASEAWAFGDGNGGEIRILNACTLHGFADDGNDGAEVLARGKFGDDATIAAVDELRGDDVG